MPAGRPSLYKEEFCERVIASGAEGKTLAEMARDLGVDRSTLADWMDQKPDFSRAVKAGLDLAQAWWEEQGRIATFGGVEGYNATSYIFQMKNRFKQDWADISRHEMTGKDGDAMKFEQVQTDAAAFTSAVTGLAARNGTTSQT